jgi:capsule polysaccharide export protein KpsE/RkpR
LNLPPNLPTRAISSLRDQRNSTVRHLLTVHAEKRKSDATSSLVDALRTSQNDLDRAVARLGDVESEVVEEAARIEALERRVEGMMDRIEGEMTRAEEDVSARLASFRKFDETFWSKERRLESQLGY